MALSGKKTVTTAGTQVALVAATQPANCPVAVKALDGNTNLVYVGDSSVASTNGFELNPGDTIIFDFVGDLLNVWVDSAVNGEGVCWLLLNA